MVERNLRKKPFENIEEKGENTGNQHFLLFPPLFLLFQQIKGLSIFESVILWPTKSFQY